MPPLVVCCFFAAAQAFQTVAYWLWIPKANTLQDELLVYLLRVDKIRALMVMGSIVLLIVPYAEVAIPYRKFAPLASVLGLIFATAFIGYEISVRSVDYFVVGQHWASQLQTASTTAERQTILGRFAIWNDVVHGLYFPLMLSYMLSSCAFAIATFHNRGFWDLLGPGAFLLNALRLLGRLLSTFAGQHWLDTLNNAAYFPAVVTINLMLAVWFFSFSKGQKASG